MNLKFPLHFQDRMFQRQIDVDHVKKAIRSPDTKENSFEGRIKITKKIDHRTITVIYFKEGFIDRKNDYIIITAYYC